MIISKDFVEIEDFLSAAHQQELIEYFTHPSFPWAMTIDAVDGVDTSKTLEDSNAIGFYHGIMYRGEQCSEDRYLTATRWIIEKLPEATFNRIKIDKLERIRVAVFTRHPDATPHKPHVDAKHNHWTAIYYVNDCDGDLLVYNETHFEIADDQILNTQFTLKHRVRPAQGKLVAFNGKHYHSSSYPTQKSLRLAITFNFTVL
jgi:hypothetical protein